jgi:hypothetical protein
MDRYLTEVLAQERIKLAKLNEDHNNLLMRIVGVTDDVLREQLGEEYVIISDKLNTQQALVTSTEAEYIAMLTLEWWSEYIDFYQRQGKQDSLLRCIEKTNHLENSSLVEELKMYRLREPTSLKHKRELCIVANTLNKKIKVMGLGDTDEIDTIGKGDDEWLLYTDRFGSTVYPMALDV